MTRYRVRRMVLSNLAECGDRSVPPAKCRRSRERTRSRASSKHRNRRQLRWPEISARALRGLASSLKPLKPEYADALHAIEVDGTSVKAYAEQKGLSSSNAAVRPPGSRGPE